LFWFRPLTSRFLSYAAGRTLSSVCFSSRRRRLTGLKRISSGTPTSSLCIFCFAETSPESELFSPPLYTPRFFCCTLLYFSICFLESFPFQAFFLLFFYRPSLVTGFLSRRCCVFFCMSGLSFLAPAKTRQKRRLASSLGRFLSVFSANKSASSPRKSELHLEIHPLTSRPRPALGSKWRRIPALPSPLFYLLEGRYRFFFTALVLCEITILDNSVRTPFFSFPRKFLLSPFLF